MRRIGDLVGEATRGWKNVRLGITAALLDFKQRCQGGGVLTTVGASGSKNSRLRYDSSPPSSRASALSNTTNDHSV
jgi:hypothetical protein